jgi:sirohydrochlorin ferrochelatase
MKLAKHRIAEIVREEISHIANEATAPKDVETLAQTMERHTDVLAAINRISNTEEAHAAIMYLLQKLGQKNLPVAQIITSLASALTDTRKGVRT